MPTSKLLTAEMRRILMATGRGELVQDPTTGRWAITGGPRPGRLSRGRLVSRGYLRQSWQIAKGEDALTAKGRAATWELP